jgi:hypothetical protein
MEGVYPKFFKKAIKGKVGGVLLNSRNEKEEFLLYGDPNSGADSTMIEIPNKEAEKFFLKYNSKTVENGYLIAISDYSINVDTTNSISDGDLLDILKMSPLKLKTKLKDFTSIVPIKRILTFAKAGNKPVKTIGIIEERLKELDK